MRRELAALVTIAALLGPEALARAQGEEETRSVPEGSSAEAASYLLLRKHTIAELEAGMIALPTAPISPAHRGGDTPLVGAFGKGDATLQTGVHLLYRWGRDFAMGAGGLFAPRPTSDDQYGGAQQLQRSHSRSYLQLGSELRYIPLHLRSVEGWVGATGGVVVIADRFSTAADVRVPPIVATTDYTVRTEGLSVGLQAGLDWLFAERLVAGVVARVDKWFLPQEATCSPIGDCATLTGAVDVIEIALRIGYRLPL